jgi:hypothetical protein
MNHRRDLLDFGAKLYIICRQLFPFEKQLLACYWVRVRVRGVRVRVRG